MAVIPLNEIPIDACLLDRPDLEGSVARYFKQYFFFFILKGLFLIEHVTLLMN